MTGYQHTNPLTIFLILSLLAFNNPQKLDNDLKYLCSALDATAKSMENLKNGITTLSLGLQQFSQQRNIPYSHTQSKTTSQET